MEFLNYLHSETSQTRQTIAVLQAITRANSNVSIADETDTSTTSTTTTRGGIRGATRGARAKRHNKIKANREGFHQGNLSHNRVDSPSQTILDLDNNSTLSSVSPAHQKTAQVKYSLYFTLFVCHVLYTDRS
jgi:hypothetical protein